VSEFGQEVASLLRKCDATFVSLITKS